MIIKRNTEIYIPEISKLDIKGDETQQANVNPEVKKSEFAVPTKSDIAPRPSITQPQRAQEVDQSNAGY